MEQQNPSFPLSKIKRIINLDRDIRKSTREATHLISLATDLFLETLIAQSRVSVLNRNRRVVRFEDVKSAVKAHGPMNDFLFDCLDEIEPRGTERGVTRGERESGVGEEIGVEELPRGTRRIDEIFRKVVDSGEVN